MNPYVILGAVILAGAAGFGLGSRLKQGEWDADVLAREAQARKVEASWSVQIAQARSARDEEVDQINGRLADALERLRKRPERMPEDSRAACKGATGSELAGPDAAFLERYAADAARQQAALGECYAWINTVKGNSSE